MIMIMMMKRRGLIMTLKMRIMIMMMMIGRKRRKRRRVSRDDLEKNMSNYSYILRKKLYPTFTYMNLINKSLFIN